MNLIGYDKTHIESPELPVGLTASSALPKESKGLIEVKDGKALQQQFESKLAAEESKGENVLGSIPKIKMQANKKQHIVEKDVSEGESEDERPPERKPMAKTITKETEKPLSKGSKGVNNKVLKEKQANAQKINMLVQDDMSFGDSDSESSDSSDFDDDVSEMRPNGKIALKKLQTSIPENLKLECTPSELLDDFFDDPLEHPLLPSNKFTKYKSEAIRPIGGLKTHQSIMASLKPKPSKDDSERRKSIDSKKATEPVKKVESKTIKQE